MLKRLSWSLLALFGLGLLTNASVNAEDTKIVLIAGRPSHPKGAHEFNAGMKLLTKCLSEVPGVKPVFVAGGWPKDETVFEDAKAIIFFMDGGGGHPIIQEDHLAKIGKLMDQGVGLACMHYGVEVPTAKGGQEFLDWIGGYYEDRFSTNPHWTAEIKDLPNHPITRGVKPFAVEDEWYYNIHFRPEMKGVTPILIAKPSDETRLGKSASPRGPYNHIVAANGRDEILAWAVERPDGGRGFGFTGGHFHKNWGNDDFRTLVLNAIVWTAKLDIPADGIKSTVSADELTQNLDPKK